MTIKMMYLQNLGICQSENCGAIENELLIPSLEMSQLIKQNTHITKPISQIFSTWQYVRTRLSVKSVSG